MLRMRYLSFLLLTAPFTAAAAPPKAAADGYRYIGDCAQGNNRAKVEKSPEMKKLLQGFGKKVGQQLPVYSCFRSQESQDKILRKNKCFPYGTVKCSGRIAANISEHTVGTAADFFVLDAKKGMEAHYCRLLDQNRKQLNGGRGGLTLYGIDTKTKPSRAGLHIDVKSDWCNWGACAKFLGDGHCKRTLYREKVAALEKSLVEAKARQARADIARLQAELQRVKGDCKPGDLKCRDSYK